MKKITTVQMSVEMRNKLAIMKIEKGLGSIEEVIDDLMNDKEIVNSNNIKLCEKLKDFDFNDIPDFYAISIFVDNQEKTFGVKNYVLNHIDEYKELEILAVDTYFDSYVFRLKGE